MSASSASRYSSMSAPGPGGSAPGVLTRGRRDLGREVRLLRLEPLAEDVAGEPADLDVFADAADRLGEHVADDLAVVLDELLVEEAALLVELRHPGLDDLVGD